MRCPIFPGILRKNDGIFMYGALQPKPFIRVYEQTELEVVLGPSCSAEKEVYSEKCISDSVPLIERRGGGGTVILAPGMVVTVIVGERPLAYTALQIFDKIHSVMIKILCEAGITSVEKKGISDLAISNKKVLGSSLYMGTNPRLYYYQSSLMVDADTEFISRYLKHPPREPDYRSGRSHEEFCTTLKQQGITCSSADICRIFNSKMGQYLVFQ